MANKRPELTPTEWSIMRVLWDRGEAIARDVWEALEPTHGWRRRPCEPCSTGSRRKAGQAQAHRPGVSYRPAVARDKGRAPQHPRPGRSRRRGDWVDLVAYAVCEGDASGEELTRLEELIRRQKERKHERPD